MNKRFTRIIDILCSIALAPVVIIYLSIRAIQTEYIPMISKTGSYHAFSGTTAIVMGIIGIITGVVVLVVMIITYKKLYPAFFFIQPKK